MTAVILLKTSDNLVIISDLMLTNDLPITNGQVIPTVHDDNGRRAGGRHIVQLYQKVIIVTERITLAYSTSYLGEITDFIGYLNRWSKNNMSFSDFDQMLTKYRKLYPGKLSRSQYILVHTEPRDDGSVSIKIANKDAARSSYGPFVGAYSIGSGGSDLLNEVGEVYSKGIENPPVISGDAASYGPLLWVPLMLVAKVTAEQYSNGFGLDKWWGGGFEISILQDKKIVKLPNYVAQFATYSKAERKFTIADYNFLQTYVGKHLVIAVQKDASLGAEIAYVPHPLYQKAKLGQMSADIVISTIIISGTDYVAYLISKGLINYHLMDNTANPGVFRIKADDKQLYAFATFVASQLDGYS